jgi:gluconate kinase
VPEKTISVTVFDRLRAEAAIALAEGDRAGARERIERARAVLPMDDAFRRALLDQMMDAAGAAERASA